MIPFSPRSRSGAAAARAALVAFLALALVILCAAPLLLSGCAPSSRATARAAVLATAEGLRVGDQACAALATRRADRELAEACAAAYEVGRPAVIAAAGAVDAWERPGARERVACSLAAALGGLEAIVAEMRRRGGEAVPPLLSDARALVALVGGCPRG